ncbi:helix-turn-helix domain-containing protein [Chitinophaga sp. Cy-1792]|uniref:helix-turn-helix domain-containing protein n=1 Tax=Chitinophaga sp. Cy-1792 TaxID=2608339 RepID=UPI00141FEDE7|nr:AraC family transcriptional regulator [Chitinophaga sp. Cy-1792]NIG55631.1 helix-turn-helix domain-containing protein [Chitinophaga sp. Cy-1792]
MQITEQNTRIPAFDLEPDDIIGSPHFRVYNFKGHIPRKELFLPHRKNHYLVAFIRKGGARKWIDLNPYQTYDNSLYFTGPHQVIVKEASNEINSTGIAFTEEFLSFQENAGLGQLPIIRNPYSRHELKLLPEDVVFVEDMLTKINEEYHKGGEWQRRMLSAYLTVLLTYLSRLYNEQFHNEAVTPDKLLLKRFQARINENYREMHEVGDYAAQLHISAGHLSEVVKAHSGKPAIKHIHERITLEARRLLFHTHQSSKEIAYDLGFADASYFNRFFKRETGMTPAAYRSSVREMYH